MLLKFQLRNIGSYKIKPILQILNILGLNAPKAILFRFCHSEQSEETDPDSSLCSE